MSILPIPLADVVETLLRQGVGVVILMEGCRCYPGGPEMLDSTKMGTGPCH